MRNNERTRIKATLLSFLAVEMKKYRTNHRLSQEALARKMRVSLSTYIGLEHGDSLPSTMTLLTFMGLMETEEITEFLQITKEVMR